MLRALLVSFAMLAVNAGPCAAETTPPAVDIRNDARNDVGNEARNRQPAPHSISVAGSSSDEDSAAENELLQAANKSRELAGVPPLRMEESLREAARAHARQMVASERLEHRLPGEPSLLERVAQVSPLRMDRAGENIANASCAPGANDVLMRSPRTARTCSTADSMSRASPPSGAKAGCMWSRISRTRCRRIPRSRAEN